MFGELRQEILGKEEVKVEKDVNVDVVKALEEGFEAELGLEKELIKIEALSTGYEVLETAVARVETAQAKGFESADEIVTGFEGQFTATLAFLGLKPEDIGVAAGFEADGEGDKGMIEKAKDMLKRMWEAIKNAAKKVYDFIKKMVKAVVDFVKGLIGKGDFAGEKIKAIVEELNKEGKTKASKDKLDEKDGKVVAGELAVLPLTGRKVEFKEVSALANNQLKLLKANIGNIDAAIKDKEHKIAIKEAVKYDVNVDCKCDEKAVVSLTCKTAKVVGIAKDGDKEKVEVVEIKKDDKVVENAGKDVPVLKIEEMTKLAETLIKNALDAQKEIAVADKKASMLEKELDKVQAEIEKEIKDAGDDEAKVKELKAKMAKVNELYVKLIPVFAKESIAIAKDIVNSKALVYVEKSAAVYTKEEEKKEEGK